MVATAFSSVISGEPRTGTIELQGGRRLAFTEVGDPGGFPVIHHHGMPGSRLEHLGEIDVFRALGVRVITPDRPGYGLSDRNPSARIVDWPGDVAALADALGIGTFGITGLSGGGIYGLACAALIPRRLSGVVVAGCPAPMNIPGAFQDMRWMTRAGMLLGRRAPRALEAVANRLAGTIRRHPGFFIDESNLHKPAADLRWMAMSDVRHGAEEMLSEAFRGSASGYAQDLRNLSRPWGFALKDIRVPVDIWHGDLDTVIPRHHADYLASAIPGSTLHICPGEGHMVFWSHVSEVFSTARGFTPWPASRARRSSFDADQPLRGGTLGPRARQVGALG